LVGTSERFADMISQNAMITPSEIIAISIGRLNQLMPGMSGARWKL